MTDPREQPPVRRHRRRRQHWYVLFLIVVTFGILGASTAVGLLIGYVNTLPPIEKLEEYNPHQATLVFDRGGTHEIGEFVEERRHVVHIQEVPDMLKKAFLAIEDDRFYDHYGVDLKALIRSLIVNRKSGASKQGGSTITMQLPRNILPEEVGRQKKIERKIKEAFLAFQIERRYSKDQILEFYLNHIAMGYNSFGIYAAADTYFSKEPKDLTLAECATLAAIPKGPTLFNPLSNPDKSLKRRNTVLQRMRELRWITEEAYQRAVSTPLEVHRSRPKSNTANSEFPYFVDGLARDLTAYYGLTETNLKEDGMMLQTTIDPRIQQISQEELHNGLVQVEKMWNEKKKERKVKEDAEFGDTPKIGQPRLMKISSVITTATVEVELGDYKGVVEFPGDPPYYDSSAILSQGNFLDVIVTDYDRSKRRMEVKPADTVKIQGSVTILDAKTAEVLALVGGDDFHDSANNGQFNRAIMGGKPAGSTVKPFFYASAMQHNFQPNDIIVDAPITLPGNPPYSPHNFERHTFFGPNTLIEALAHSRNVSTVRLFQKIGVKRALADVWKFDYRPKDSNWRAKFRPEFSMCLGPIDMNSLEIASAYFVFANQGIGRHPLFFKRMTDHDNRPLISPKPDEAVVLDPIAAYQVLFMLHQVVLTGTASKSIGPLFPSPPYPPICGKTGTTDDNTDAWFTGITPDLIICVYIGFDTPRSLGPDMTGGKAAAPVWAGIFKRVFTTRDEWKMDFDAPSGIEKIDICSDSGKAAAPSCSNLVYKGVPFKAGKGPRERCDGRKFKPTIEEEQTEPDGDAREPQPAADPGETPAVDSSVIGSAEPYRALKFVR